jgi:CheY-like chemotaxis protein
MSNIAPSSQQRTVLLVDDNEDDAFLMRRIFERVNRFVTLWHTKNGVECMNFLRRKGPYAAAPRPDLILLDLNMPIMDGREVLSEIVKDDALRSLPVVVLTTSNQERDRFEMYRLRCSSYIRKPVDSVEFEAMVKELANYWFNLVVPPPFESPGAPK